MNYTRHFNCGCKVVVIGEITNAEIQYCPKHEAAPDMYEALKGLMDIAEIAMPDTFFQSDSRTTLARQALAKAEGGNYETGR